MSVYEEILQKSIEQVSDIKGKKILMRIDINSTLDEYGNVPHNDWRIHKALESIKYLTERGARIILLSHRESAHESLKPMYEYMKGYLSLGFIPRYDIDVIERSIERMQHGGALLLENVRDYSGEFENDSSYLDEIISLCDIYVNDAFSVSHRNHASVSDITKKLPSYFGMQLCNEVKFLSESVATEHREGRVLVLGGAKFGTKLELLRKLLPQIDYALVGGALANVFLRERGFNIGASFADSVDISDIVEHPKVILPLDAIDQEGDVISIDEVRDHDMILDIGPQTEKLFEQIIDNAHTVLWNGPMGKYEDGYSAGSRAVAESISHAQAFSVTGGGDTAAVIVEAGMQKRFDFISTGGGAMLDFLVSGTLPGIQAILKNKE